MMCYKYTTLFLNYALTQNVKCYLAIIIGTIFQWFDFALFSSVSDRLADSFYPPSLPHSLSILTVWLSFAAGWLLTPIGGIIFGYIGDAYSRKAALSLSISLMSGASLIIAILPAYHTIGLFAPILILAARLMQGLSSSAEYNGAAVYLIENSSERFKPLSGCLPNIANSMGMMLGFFAGAIFTKSTMPIWAWRIPFFLAFIGLVCAYRLRGKILRQNSIIKLIRFKADNYSKFIKKTGLIISLAAYNGVTSWGIYVWLPVLLTHFGLTNAQASIVILIGLALDIIIEPTTGLIAQHKDSKKIFLLFSVFFIIGLYPFLRLFQYGSFSLDIAAIAFITFLISPPTAMINSIAVRTIDKRIRYLTLGIFWNIGMTLFGGTAPAVFSFFTHSVHYARNVTPLLILSYMSIFVLLSLFLVNKNDRQ